MKTRIGLYLFLILGSFFSHSALAGVCSYGASAYIDPGDDHAYVRFSWETEGCKKIKNHSGNKGRYRFKVKQAHWPFATNINKKENHPKTYIKVFQDPFGQPNEEIKVCMYYKRKSGVFRRVQGCGDRSY